MSHATPASPALFLCLSWVPACTYKKWKLDPRWKHSAVLSLFQAAWFPQWKQTSCWRLGWKPPLLPDTHTQAAEQKTLTERLIYSLILPSSCVFPTQRSRGCVDEHSSGCTASLLHHICWGWTQTLAPPISRWEAVMSQFEPWCLWQSMKHYCLT